MYMINFNLIILNNKKIKGNLRALKRVKTHYNNILVLKIYNWFIVK